MLYSYNKARERKFIKKLIRERKHVYITAFPLLIPHILLNPCISGPRPFIPLLSQEELYRKIPVLRMSGLIIKSKHSCY